MSRSKRLCEAANAAPGSWRHRLAPHRSYEIELVQPLVLLLLVSDIPPNHLFISPNRRYKIPSRPKVLTNKVALTLPIHSSYVDRTLSFYVSHHLRHRILRRYRNQHVHMVCHQVPLQNLALLALRQLPKRLPKVGTQLRVQRLPPGP
ncbi:protein of unknown function [Denitratisoma oestradiolicum]|uniref:Uncharacterized protein n=1 Tax=Denitratisoma oestradiolicum TaxID=311182 RepID=A0A6S6YQ16_9PROT|nr:protein of unknown function [Denitratisoma oestradiolicum]